MAIDAGEADVDEAGGKAHLSGVKAALTDPKVIELLLIEEEVALT